jgi:hypothetical protein
MKVPQSIILRPITAALLTVLILSAWIGIGITNQNPSIWLDRGCLNYLHNPRLDQGGFHAWTHPFDLALGAHHERAADGSYSLKSVPLWPLPVLTIGLLLVFRPPPRRGEGRGGVGGNQLLPNAL